MDEACLAEGAALEHRLAWLEEQQASNRALRELLATRAECLLRKGDLAAHEAAEQAKQVRLCRPPAYLGQTGASVAAGSWV